MRLRTVLFGVATGLFLAAPALAQSPQDRATARNAAEEADKKLAAKDLDGALDLFTKADALVPAPTLKLQIARVQVQRGKLVEAQQILIDASRSAPTAGEPPSWAKAREQAAKEAADLKARVPAVEIIVEPKDKPSRVTVDGEAVSAASLGVPRATNPGQHTIRAEGDGFQPAETTIVLKEGDRTQVVLRLAQAGAAPLPVPPPGGPAQPGQPGEARPAATAEAPPPPTRGAHVHDGFFLRLGLGAAFHSSTLTSSAGIVSINEDISGTGVAFDTMIGGAFAPGWILAADLGGHTFSDPTVKSNGASQTVKGSVSYSRVGAAIVWYPAPTKGFHAFAGAGLGIGKFKPDNSTAGNDVDVKGLELTAGAGYELWIGQEWSMGGLLRLEIPSLTGSNNVPAGNTTVSVDRKLTGVIPVLMGNVTFN